MKQILPITVLTVIGVALTVLLAGRLAAAPMGTVLTYQGHLDQVVVSTGGIGRPPASSQSPVTGVCDFQFSLWDALTSGNLVGATQTVSAVSVSNGWFTVLLDFGANAFNGDARWLEIGVRTNGVGAFSELAPRQEAPLMPYALYAAEAGNVATTNVSGGTYSNVTLTGSSTIPYATTASGGWPTTWAPSSITAGNLPSTVTNTAPIAASQLPGGVLTNNETGVTVSGTFTNGAYYGNGIGLTNIPTSGVTNFLGGVTNAVNGMTNGLATTNYVNVATNGFVTASVTNGLATTNYVLVTATNIAGSLTNGFINLASATNVAGSLTNGFVSILTATNIASNQVYSATNSYMATDTNIALVMATNVASALTNGLATTNYVNVATNGFVTASTATNIAGSLTNGFINLASATNVAAALTNGLATTNYVNVATNGFVTQSITNGLATTNYVNVATNGFVTQSITNGLATTNYVLTQGTNIALVTATNVASALTNGLATTNYVIMATNNLGNSVAVTMTNAANLFSGNGGGLTNLEANSLTNFSLSHILFVDLNGNDATAIRGDITHAWGPGPTNALYAATNNDVVLFGAGTFTFNSTPSTGIKNGVTVSGMGNGTMFIGSGTTPQIPWATNNVTYQNFSASNLMYIYSTPPGLNQTNINFLNINWNNAGMVDIWKNANGAKIYNSRIIGCNLISGGDLALQFYNCEFGFDTFLYYTNLSLYPNRAELVSQDNNSIHDSLFVISNGVVDVVYNNGQGGNITYFHNVSVINIAANVAIFDAVTPSSFVWVGDYVSNGVFNASSGFTGNGLGLTNIPTSGVTNFLGSVTNVAGSFTNNLATTNYVNVATNGFVTASTATNIVGALALTNNGSGYTLGTLTVTNLTNSSLSANEILYTGAGGQITGTNALTFYTNTLILNTAQLSITGTAGGTTNAPTVLSVTGGTGGVSGGAGQAGAAISLTTGTGGNGAVNYAPGGAGGSITLSTGAGGVNQSSVGGAGGSVTLNTGAGGTSTNGTGGSGGSFYLLPGNGGVHIGSGSTGANGFVGMAVNASGVASGDVRVGLTNIPATGVSFSVGQSASVTSNLTVGGTNTAGYFIGNGGGLTNIPTSGVTNFLGDVTNVVNPVSSNMVWSGTNNYMATATNIVGALALTNNGNGYTLGTLTVTNLTNSSLSANEILYTGTGGQITGTNALTYYTNTVLLTGQIAVTGTGGGTVAAPTVLSVTGGTGGVNGGSGAGQAGAAISLTTGAGGNGTASYVPGGAGGSITLNTGAGGTSMGGSSATGGAFNVTLGNGGSAGISGASGAGGSFTMAGGKGGSITNASFPGGSGGNFYLLPGAGGTNVGGGPAGSNGFIGMAVNASGVALGDVRVGLTNIPATGVSFSVGQSASVTSNLTVGGTNTAGYYIGNGGGLTNIPTSSVTNFLGDVTNVVTGLTNGLATTNYVNVATNGFVTASTATNIVGALALTNNGNGYTLGTLTVTNLTNSSLSTNLILYTGAGGQITGTNALTYYTNTVLLTGQIAVTGTGGGTVAAPSVLSVTGGTGGTNVSNVGQAGAAISLTAGAGGNAAAPYAPGGNGGSITLNAGAGGNENSGSVGSGGNIYLISGNKGTGTGTVGVNGFVGMAVNASGVASGDVRVGTTNPPATGVSLSVGQSASVTSNLTVGGTNTAGYFIGNGGGLTNVAGSIALSDATNVANAIVQTATNNVLATATNSFYPVSNPSNYVIGSYSNKLAPTAFAVGASPVSLTNTFGKGVEVFIWGGVLQSVSLNSGSLMTNVSTICMQTNEYITVTYTGTIQAQWHPFP